MSSVRFVKFILVMSFVVMMFACSGSQTTDDTGEVCADAFLSSAMCTWTGRTLTSTHLYLEDAGDVLYDDDLTTDDISSELMQDTISSDGITPASAENPWYWLSLDSQVSLADDSSYRIVIHSHPFDPENLANLASLDGAYCSLDGNASNTTPPLCEITQFTVSANNITTLTGWDNGDVVGTISYTVYVNILDDSGNITGSMVFTATDENLEWDALVPAICGTDALD